MLLNSPVIDPGKCINSSIHGKQPLALQLAPFRQHVLCIETAKGLGTRLHDSARPHDLTPQVEQAEIVGTPANDRGTCVGQTLESRGRNPGRFNGPWQASWPCAPPMLPALPRMTSPSGWSCGQPSR